MESSEVILNSNEKKKKDKKVKNKNLINLILLIGAVLAFIFSVSIGSVNIEVKEVISCILGTNQDLGNTQVINNIRLPRAIISCLVGINLSLSGCILQGVMNNPLADPQIIGVSSGAGLFGMVILILYPEKLYLLPIISFIGAMGACIFIYILAWKKGINTVRVILAGVAVSTLLSAGMSALMVFFSDRIFGAITFMNGSLASKSWPYVYVILPYTILGIILCIVFSKKLNVLALGDDVARSLGLNVELTRLGFTALAAILAASAVSVAGLLGFVGLIVPHMARMIIGSDHKYLFPTTAILGSLILCASDTIARVAFRPMEIPAGIIMATFGAPYFLFLLRRQL